MAKKCFLVLCIVLSSFVLCASPGLFISGLSSESTGYTGFLGTDSWTVHKRINVNAGMTFGRSWAFYLTAGADYNHELKSFTPFSSLSDGFSLRCGLGGQYSKNIFTLDFSSGLKVTDMALDELNKYAELFFEATGSAVLLNYGKGAFYVSVPVNVSFNGCGCNFDMGLGVKAVYRVDFGGGK